MREKQKIAGIWMNADSNRFRSAPSFYAVASSRPVRELVDERTAAIYELGLGDLQLSPGGGALPDKERRFEAGLLDLRKRQGLYAEAPNGVEISEGVLYRARIAIPSQVPVGTYTAETFLIDRGKVIAAATRDVEIGKGGVRTLGRARRAPAMASSTALPRCCCRSASAGPRHGRSGDAPKPYLNRSRLTPLRDHSPSRTRAAKPMTDDSPT